MQKTHITRILHPSGKLYAAWCDFVAGHPEANFFQSDGFFRLAGRWPGAEPVLLLTIDASHQVTGSLLSVVLKEGGAIAGWLSARTMVYGGPLLSRQRRLQEHLSVDALLKALIAEVGGKTAYVRFFNFRDWSDGLPVFNGHGFRYEERPSLMVGTSKRAKAWGGLSDVCRSRVKSSLKEGAGVITHPTKKQIEAFYAILSSHYRAKPRKPLPPLAMFEAFAEMCRNDTPPQGYSAVTGPDLSLSSGNMTGKRAAAAGVMLLVEVGDRVVGGVVAPMMAGQGMFLWHVCGMEAEMNGRGVYPGALAVWSAIEHASEAGVRYLDFMGEAAAHMALREAEQCFGGEKVNDGGYLRVNSRVRYLLGRLG